MSKSHLLFLTLLSVFALSACSTIESESSSSNSSSESSSSVDPSSSSSEQPVVKPIFYHYPASEATCTRFANYECWIKESNGTVVTETAPRNATIVEADPLALEDNEFKEYYKGPALGHSWSTWTDKPGEEATCWQAGKEIRECFVCHLEEERGKQVNHIFNDVVTEPTCTTGGYTTHTCTECGYEVVDTITSPNGHSLSPVSYEAATCTEDGHVAHYHCGVCHHNFEDDEGEIEIDDVTLPQIGHAWANQSYSYNSDYSICYAHATCTHDPEHELNDEAACVSQTTVGTVTTYEFAPFTQSTVFETQTIKINSHVHTLHEEYTNPTCGHDGYTTKTCTDSDCDYFEVVVDEGSALTHSMHHYEAVPQTCTADGNIEYYECETVGGCGLKYTDSQGLNPVTNVVLPKYGHNYVEEVTAPTCTEAGYTTHTCTRCGEHYEDTHTEPTGHQWSEWVDDPDHRATCTEAGKEIRECSACHEVQYRDKAATGHAMQFSHFEWANNNTTAKAVYICSHSCGETLKYDASMSDPVPVTNPTCISTGAAEYTATHEDPYTLEEHHDTKQSVVAIDPNAHNFEDVVTQPTCENQGYTTHTCTRCGYSYVDSYVDPLGHNYETKSYKWTYNDSAPTTAVKKIEVCSRDAVVRDTENSSDVATNTALAVSGKLSELSMQLDRDKSCGDINLHFSNVQESSDLGVNFDTTVRFSITKDTAGSISDILNTFVVKVDNSYYYNGNLHSGTSYTIVKPNLTGSVNNGYSNLTIGDSLGNHNESDFNANVKDDMLGFINGCDVVMHANLNVDIDEPTLTIELIYYPVGSTYSSYSGYTQTFTSKISEKDLRQDNWVNSVRISRMFDKDNSNTSTTITFKSIEYSANIDRDIFSCLCTSYSKSITHGWWYPTERTQLIDVSGKDNG